MAKKINFSKKAIFITIEGLEGSGKSSVVEFLENLFKKNGLKVQAHREPGSTKVGQNLREILLDKKNSEISLHTELLLYLAARTQLIEEKLIKDLSVFDVVLCDRFYDSTLAYQGHALGLGKVAQDAVDIFSLGLKPDLTIFLDTEVKAGLKRLKTKDRIESRPISFHNKLRQGFLNLAKREPERIKIVDASGSLNQVYSKVKKVLAKEEITSKLIN